MIAERSSKVKALIRRALRAFAAAGDLAELKAARLEHAGDRSPIALAMREIPALPPAVRVESANRVGQARERIIAAAAARRKELEA